jgi:site-specific DNA-cytosine methylase
MTAIDLFAGFGGNTQGAKRAGVKVLWAANHNRRAVDLHAANHPETEHSCQDLHQADFHEAPDHNALLGSPDCTGHTDARGVPQHRVRVFIILSRSRSPLKLRLPSRGHVPASAFVDLEAGEWSDWRKLCEKTRARIRNGRKRFGDLFVAPYYGTGSGLTGRSLDLPIGTITTKDRWQIVNGFRQRLLSVEECRAAMGFPASYILPKQKHLAKLMLGQAVCPPVVTDILNALKSQS